MVRWVGAIYPTCFELPELPAILDLGYQTREDIIVELMTWDAGKQKLLDLSRLSQLSARS